jgi:threonine/homoserine/homoserine lactone efflux protein
VLTYFILGASYGFAAAVQPGQFQAYLLSHTMTHGWRRTLPVVFAPILSDIPVVSLVLLVLTQVPPVFVHVLQVAGGVFLLYLALGALTAARSYERAAAEAAPAHRSILNAAVVNLLNPNPYLAWALILGPLLMEAWRRTPAAGVGLVASFYSAMVLATVGIVLLLGAARSLGPRVARTLVAVSAVALAGFGLYQLIAGARALL